MTSHNHTYEYALGYILMPLPAIDSLPAEMQLSGRGYILSPHLHCSLVAVKRLAPLLVAGSHLTLEEATVRVADVALAAVHKHRPIFEGYLNEIRLADHPERDRHTLIVMARVNGLDKIFDDINRELKIDAPLQVPHVTLYTAANGLAIGVTSPAECRHITRPLDRREATDLTKQLDPYKSFRWSYFMTPAPVRNNLMLELHVPGFAAARDFYKQFGFIQINYDPISGGGDSDLGYIELKREDKLGRSQLNFYGDNQSVAGHARFNLFPPTTPRGYAVEITIPVADVVGLWERVGRHLPPESISEPLIVKRWGKLDFRVVDPYGFYVRFSENVDWMQDV
jgi:hypothetical protein